jgi:MFS family permease
MRLMTRLAHPPVVAVALAGMAALMTAMGIGRFAFTPLLPLMQAEAGLSLADGGWLAGANYLGYLAGALAATRRTPAPAAMLCGGLAAVVLTTAAMAPLTSFAGWALLRFVAGMASAWALVATAALCIARLNAAGRPRLAGVSFAGVGLGIALAGLACQAVVLAGGGMRAGWWVLAALGAALALPAVVVLSRGAPAAARPAAAADGPADIVDARHLVWSYGLFGFGYILPATFLPAQARVLVADPAVFGWVWPVFGAAAAVSMWIAVGGRVNARRARWSVAQMVMAAGVLLPALHASLATITLSALCVGGTFMVVTLLALQEGAAVGGAGAQRLIATMTAAFAAGQLLGPVAATVLEMAGFGMDAALMIAAGGLAVGAVLPGWARPGSMHTRENTR